MGQPLIERWDIQGKGNVLHDAFTAHHVALYRAAADVIGPALCDEPRVIVDAACGMGHGFVVLGGLGHYLGLDCDSGAIRTAQERYPAGEFCYADFTDRWWLRCVRPDVVVSLETAEHLDDPESFLRRVALSLPVHGLFVFSAPTCLTRDFDPFHRWDIPSELWAVLLSKAGFTIERSQTFTLKGSFREFIGVTHTTWRQKLRVAMFDLTHPMYLIDRLWNWILKDRFEWQSTLFVCRPVRAARAYAPPSFVGIEAME